MDDRLSRQAYAELQAMLMWAHQKPDGTDPIADAIKLHLPTAVEIVKRILNGNVMMPELFALLLTPQAIERSIMKFSLSGNRRVAEVVAEGAQYSVSIDAAVCICLPYPIDRENPGRMLTELINHETYRTQYQARLSAWRLFKIAAS